MIHIVPPGSPCQVCKKHSRQPSNKTVRWLGVHRLRGFFDPYQGVGPVDLIVIDVVGSKPAQGVLDLRQNAGPAGVAKGASIPPTLGGLGGNQNARHREKRFRVIYFMRRASLIAPECVAAIKHQLRDTVRVPHRVGNRGRVTREKIRRISARNRGYPKDFDHASRYRRTPLP
jgi:hypothetical protein